MEAEAPFGGRTTRSDEPKKKVDSMIISFGQLQEASLVSPRMFFVVEGRGENSRPVQNLKRKTNEERDSTDGISTGDHSLGRIRGHRVRTKRV